MKFSSALPAFTLLAAGLAHALTITGTVSDRTTNKVAAGDTVVLIGFGQGMQEVARTTTDAHGRYSIQAPDDAAGGGGTASGTHLIRVDHQKATYFQPAPPGAHTVDVDVYDVSEAVKGITTEADVLSLQTDPGGLHVVENYFVRNDSKPAMTQLSRRAYEINLPPGAKIEASAAMGPAGMPVASSPIPTGEPNRYAFVFPVRPGETRFQVSYHLPYSGSLAFASRVALPTENFVVILPKAMQFAPRDSGFQPVPNGEGTQTFVEKGVTPAQTVAYTVSGSGQMPREAQTGPGGQGAGADASGQAASGPGSEGPAQPDAGANIDNRPGGGLGPPIDTPDPLNKYKWWILSALALLLAAAAAWLLRKPKSGAQSGSQAGTGPQSSRPKHPALQPALQSGFAPGDPRDAAFTANAPQPDPTLAGVSSGANPLARPQPASQSFLGSLKEALFTLEAERLSGQIGEEDYGRLKASLEVVLRQALEHDSVRR